ncbi:MAG TPA: ferrous iron transport protein A [Firmicutes bacterium]|nr:ferrous iron transport protein A [Candidatus Fermentithermobacillaceae bacterium]
MSGALASPGSTRINLDAGKTASPNCCTALSELSSGEAGTLHQIHLTGILRLRLLDLGFTHGTLVEVVRKGPGGRLLAVRVRGAVLALRHRDAVRISVAR